MLPGVKMIVGLVSGLLGGFFGGLLGLGGGIIMIPLMTWLGRITQHSAHGTSLVAIVFTALSGAGAYYIHGKLDWKTALVLAASATVTARFGARYAHSLSEKRLKKAFGLFLVFASVMLVTKSYLPTRGLGLEWWSSAIIFLVIGSATGFISGLMGVGGGGIMVPLMVILGNMGQHTAQGTSLLAMVPAGMSGAATHYRLGNVDTGLVWGLSIGSLVGGYFGATAANLFPELHLRIAFATLGIWVGMRYIRA
ncbi:MAG: Sulfite exporter TauE/SafE [Syntrophorhabdus sp. PtaU1.Bin153]|nr:MAG: Sulfite exporter TauE/SafE [Syntrophorhabdus sp. PtaU1.Bin153]